MLVASAEDNLAGVGHAVAKGRLTGVCPLWTTSTASGSLSLGFMLFRILLLLRVSQNLAFHQPNIAPSP